MKIDEFSLEWMKNVCEYEFQATGKELTVSEFTKRWNRCGGDITLFEFKIPFEEKIEDEEFLI